MRWLLFTLGLVVGSLAVFVAVGSEVSMCLGHAGQAIGWLVLAVALTVVTAICWRHAFRAFKASPSLAGRVAQVGGVVWLVLVIGFFVSIRMNDARRGLRDAVSEVEFQFTRSFDSRYALMERTEAAERIERDIDLAGWWGSSHQKAIAHDMLIELKREIAQAYEDLND